MRPRRIRMKLRKLDKIPVGLAFLCTFLVLKGISYFKIKSKKNGRKPAHSKLGFKEHFTLCIEDFGCCSKKEPVISVL